MDCTKLKTTFRTIGSLEERSQISLWRGPYCFWYACAFKGAEAFPNWMGWRSEEHIWSFMGLFHVAASFWWLWRLVFPTISRRTAGKDECRHPENTLYRLGNDLPADGHPLLNSSPVRGLSVAIIPRNRMLGGVGWERLGSAPHRVLEKIGLVVFSHPLPIILHI